MSDLETIRSLIKTRMKRVLEYGEVALSRAQFAAFRKLVLDEFGRSGLESELERVFRKDQGAERHGQAHIARKGG